MSWWGVGAAAVSIIGGLVSDNQKKKAAQGAANQQAQAAAEAAALEEKRLNEAKELMASWVVKGAGAMNSQADLLGVNGPDAQKKAVAAIQESEKFKAITQQGENAILQNAAATGGLRGGNVQAALGQFRPQVLSSLIEQQYNQLGQLSQLGQASAAGQAAMGIQTGQLQATQFGNLGAAQAGGALAQGALNANSAQTTASGVSSILGAIAASKKF